MKNRPLTPDKKQATIVIKKKTSRKGSNARVARVDTFPLKTLSLCVFMSCNSAWATDYFDPELLALGTGTSDVDLSAFANPGGVVEGDYLVNIFINQRMAMSRTIPFRKNAQGKVVAELTPALLNDLGVNVDHLPAFKDLPKDKPVKDLAELIPQSSVKLDIARLRLDISIPQVAMQPGKNSRMDPELWDDGIPALLFNYSLSAGRTEQNINNDSRHMNNLFANVQTGANLGAWRLRSTITHNYSDQNGGRNGQSRHTDDTRFSNTYLMRDIRAWRSHLTIGESSTGSEVLDGVPFRGVQLQSSEQMLPARLRGFAPQITGIANSNARVTIRQNGYVVYETYVAPGPFEIKDLYQAGMSGDLEVTITEADGSVRSFVVPYSTLPVMLRPGTFKYEVTAGRYDGGLTYGSRQENFVLGTLIYGLPKNITLYGGGLVSEYYTALSLGSGVSLGDWGAVSADATLSNARFQGESRETGGSWRLRYSKSLLSTGTSIDLTALRYSTKNFYTFSEYNTMGYARRDEDIFYTPDRRRSSFQTQVSQQLGELGSISLRAHRDEYWGSTKTLTGLSAGYNGGFKGVSYGLYYTIDRMKGNGSWPENRQVTFSLNIPFSIFSYSPALQNVYATSQISHDNTGRTLNQAGISGSNGNFSYSMMQNWGNQNQASNSNLNMGWQGSKGSINAGYGYSHDTRSMNMNITGGAIAHSEGLTLSRTLGSSMALVSAPEASGVRLTSGNGVTDWQGFAVAPYLSDYTSNNIGLDPSTLPDNVDLPKTNVEVYPTKGAVVKADFATRIGYQVLMTLTRVGGMGVVPFGATVSLLNNKERDDATSIVGDNGQVYMAGLPVKGELSVVWGKGADKQCRVNFNLNGLKPTAQMPVIQLNGDCR